MTVDESETPKKKNNKGNLRLLLIIGIVIVVLLWIIIPSMTIWYFGKPDSSGTFGDTFGIINALFSSLAFALLIYTSMMQREELELQREELKLTRKELELTRIELEKSASAQNTLVELTREELELQKNIRKSQIKPELKLDGTRWVTKFDNTHYLELKLKVRYHKLKIYKVEIQIGHSDLVVDTDSVFRLAAKYFEESEDIFILLSSMTKTPSQPTGLKVNVQFMDIDSQLYKQVIQFTSDTQFIGNVQIVDIYSLIN